LPALIALAAFGLNLLSVRLATLVRTDMPLALATFAAGLLMFEKSSHPNGLDNARSNSAFRGVDGSDVY
jgi:hypothetical protein